MGMSLRRKVRWFRDRGYTIYYVPRPDDWQDVSWVRPLDLEKRPDVDLVPFVDLGIRGEDQANQADSVERSNHRSMKRDTPDQFTMVSWVNVDTLGVYVQKAGSDLFKTLDALADYPVYDESDLSDLEQEEITASWDQYAKIDLCREAEDLLGSDVWNDVRDAWEADGSELGSIVWDAMYDADAYPEHRGTEVVWFYPELIRPMWARMVADLLSAQENPDQLVLI